jgi:phosphofructokinase-like protein
MIQRIGILTSGGDCAGLNAVIRAVAHRAIEGYGWDVLGLRYGTQGLLQEPKQYCHLTLDMLDGNMLRLGGTILGTTNKGAPFDHAKEIIAAIKELQIDAIIGVGGDGSLNILNDLMKMGNIKFIGIPKTIDNDLGSTEISIGFSTAVEVATEALDRLQPTAASHDRVMILEVMGRDAGHIALNAGIAGGADIILIPEIPYTLENVANKIKKINSRGRNFALVVVAESVKTERGESSLITDSEGRKRYGGIGQYLSEKITETTGAETRCTVLGHVQRGGQPNASDRVLAAALGVHAVDLIAKGSFSRMVAWQNRHVIDVPLEEAIAQYEAVNVSGTLVRTARGLGICLGDS